jgi:hypothetical protein
VTGCGVSGLSIAISSSIVIENPIEL